MKLYLLRHCSANDFAPDDDRRELTAQGETEARLAGAALAKLGANPVRVFASPLLRAQQTARLVIEAFGIALPVERLNELENGATTTDLLGALRSHARAGDLLLVGHMPSLAGHVAALVGKQSAETFAFGKGAVACVELERLQLGGGQLLWMYGQAQLKRLAA